VTPNAALDRTYHISDLTLSAGHPGEDSHARVGGKGPEVARALGGAGVAVPVADLAARSTGQQIETLWRCPTPFAEAHRNTPECVLPQAWNQ
jgi:fructose-1-phosphate kinase PfkB-like protein